MPLRGCSIHMWLGARYSPSDDRDDNANYFRNNKISNISREEHKRRGYQSPKHVMEISVVHAKASLESSTMQAGQLFPSDLAGSRIRD